MPFWLQLAAGAAFEADSQPFAVGPVSKPQCSRRPPEADGIASLAQGRGRRARALQVKPGAWGAKQKRSMAAESKLRGGKKAALVWARFGQRRKVHLGERTLRAASRSAVRLCVCVAPARLPGQPFALESGANSNGSL